MSDISANILFALAIELGSGLWLSGFMKTFNSSSLVSSSISRSLTLCALGVAVVSALGMGLQSEAATLLEAIPSHARKAAGGGGVGNGGGTVVCRNPQTRAIERAELLDYFEARVIRDLKITVQMIPGTWEQKLHGLIEILGRYSALRKEVYTLWANSFKAEAKMLQGVEFSKVADSMHIGVPNGCEFVQAAVQILPQFKGDHRYYINQDVWDLLDDSSKAGLVLHEFVFREALSSGHANSIATRYVVAKISSEGFSDLTESAFVELLKQARFEQTDIQSQMEGLKQIVRPEQWWRAPAFEPEVPEFTLQSRTLVNLGVCEGEGCERLTPVQPHSVCSGVEAMILPNGQRIDWKVALPFARNASESRTRCGEFLSWQYANQSPTTSNEGLLLSVGRSLGVSPYRYLSTEILDGNLVASQLRFDSNGSLLYFEAESFYLPFMKLQPLFHPGTESLGTSYPKVAGYFHESGLTVHPAQDILHNSRAQIEVELLGIHWSLRPTTPIHFEKINGSYHYSKGGGMVQVHDIFRDISSTMSRSNGLMCETGPCMELVRLDMQDSTEVRVRTSANVLMLIHITQGPNTGIMVGCKFKPGIFDLHPRTAVPKTAVAAERCKMPGVSSTEVAVEENQVVVLNAEGLVVSVSQ